MKLGPRTRIVQVWTGDSALADADVLATIRDDAWEGSDEGTITVFDLDNGQPTPQRLLDLFRPLREASRPWGTIAYVISSGDEATREIVAHLADANDVAVYITPSLTQIAEAQPAGDVSAADEQTLDVLHRLGGTLTAAELGEWLKLPQTAAGNRLVNLARKGLVLRVQRPRRQGDQFIDPRSIAPHTQLVTN